MPTYSYLCTECDHDFDIHQAFTDDSLTVCPVCGGQLRKVFNSIGVTFNGPGFYRTDSRAAASDKLSATRADKQPTEKKPSEGKDSGGRSGKDSGSSSGKDSGTSTPKESAKPKEKSRTVTSGSAKTAS